MDEQTVRVTALNSEQTLWLRRVRDSLRSAAESGPVRWPPEADISAMEIADGLIAWWHVARNRDAFSQDEIIDMAGVALGDALAKEFKLAWHAVEDADGPFIGLAVEPPCEGDQVVLAPASTIAKRFEKDKVPGLVQDMYDALCDVLIKDSLVPRRDDCPDAS